MKIAVTGSSGFIGRELTRQLSAHGHELVALVRQESQATDNAHCWWQPEHGIQQLNKLEGMDAVVHLAGRGIADHRWTPKEKTLIRQSRIEATSRLCNDLLQLKQPPRIFLSASAIGIYGDCGNALVSERHPAGNGFLAETTADWEAAVTSLVNAGLRVMHARFGIVLSRTGGALAKMLPLFRWGLGSNLGNGEQYWSWIALHDAVSALHWMLGESSASGAYNVVSPEPVSNAHFTLQLARALHRWRFVPAPALALKLLFGEMADAALLASCRAVPERLSAAGFKFAAPSLDQAFQQLLGTADEHDHR
jgi:uncharacterized protein